MITNQTKYLKTMKNPFKIIIIIFSLFITINTTFCWENPFESQDIATESFIDFCYKNGINLELDGFTLLHLAAERGQADHLLQLIENNKKDINLRDKALGNTPLYYAIYKDHKDIVSILINENADVNMYLANDLYKQKLEESNLRNSIINTDNKIYDNPYSNGFVPLYIAVEKNNLEIVELLLAAGADPNLPSQGFPPLFLAIEKNHPKIVQVLLEAGADSSLPSQSGTFPLHKALAEEIPNPEIIQLLLSAGADPNKRSGLGVTPLAHLSAKDTESKEAIKIVQLLLAAGADPNLSSQNIKSLNIALQQGHQKIADLLIEAGAIKD